ncbi:MAG TPA: hypothetical protein VEZ41_16580, partial [Allosphingosinicella sp.]|nr:hypothetical protein [Allosphingosinicella sp.]
MALAALISATREAREPGVALRATFWLAGRTLIERQARLAVTAGASQIIILVESFPAELVQAVERLRGEGLQVVTARTAAEAAAAIGPGMRLMLVADGFVGDRAHVERLMGADRPVLLAVTDRGFDDRFERIDGEMRWAGLALVDGDLLRDAALMPSDWDVQSTLLRRALQTGVKPLPLVDEREAAELGIVERRQDFAELQRRILAGAASGPRNWFSRTVLAPIERLATGAIMASPLTPMMIGTAGAVLMGLALLAFAFDWRWLGLLPVILALPLEGIAIRLSRLRLQRLRPNAWWRALIPMLAGAALVALGMSLAREHGWGMILLAALTVIFLIAL